MAFLGDKENLGDAVCSAWDSSAACLGGRPRWLCCCHRFAGRYDKGLLSVPSTD